MGKHRSGKPAFYWRPINEPQRQAMEFFREGADVLFLVGPAGTGKTLASLALAVGEVISTRADGITLLRPTIESSRPMGFLPGEVPDKLEPHLAAYRETLPKIVFDFPADLIEARALQFLRGLTFDRRVVLLDEAQNCTYEDLTLVLTRLGEGSRLLILGDPEQPDISGSGLLDFRDALVGAPGVESVVFADNDAVRHSRLAIWLARIRAGAKNRTTHSLHTSG